MSDPHLRLCTPAQVARNPEDDAAAFIADCLEDPKKYMRGASEDLLQEFRLKVWRAQSRIEEVPADQNARVKFVQTIANNVRISHLRNWTRRPEVQLEAVHLEVASGDAPQVRDLELRRLLEKLTPAHRDALHLHYWEGLTYEEMGELLRITKGAAQMRTYRGVQALRRAWGGQE